MTYTFEMQIDKIWREQFLHKKWRQNKWRNSV